MLLSFLVFSRHQKYLCRYTDFPMNKSSVQAFRKRWWGGFAWEDGRTSPPTPDREGRHNCSRQVFRLWALHARPSRYMNPKTHVPVACISLESGCVEQTSMPITAARPRRLFTALPFSPGLKQLPGHQEHPKPSSWEYPKQVGRKMTDRSQ